mgnify:CR=1 FL=1
MQSMEATQGNKPVGRIITLQEAAEILSVSYSTAFRIRNSWRTSTVACAQYIDRQMRVQNDVIRYSDREARHGED